MTASTARSSLGPTLSQDLFRVKQIMSLFTVKDALHFVVIDLDVQRSPEQQQLVKQYYTGYIPHVLVLDARGEPLYNRSGEVDSRVIEDIFKRSLASE